MRIKPLALRWLSSAGMPGFRGWTPTPRQASERFPTTEEFIARHAEASLNLPKSQSLDLGCGRNPRNPFHAERGKGVDINPSEDGSILCSDLGTSPIPCESESFDFVTAFDFLEHIQRVAIVSGSTRYPFIELMNEIHRILKPGGLFFSRTPAYPHKEAFQDPTHVNIITEDTFPLYFCNECWANAYGFKGSFALVAQEWCRPSLLALLRKA